VFAIPHEQKLLGAVALFIVCVAPTFISYRPYQFEWDDSDYLRRSITVSRSFWTRDVHGVGAMVSIRPPAMTLLGLPWGPTTSWDAAGKCFVTLGVVTSLLAALCLYLLLRTGVKAGWLVVASVCVGVALGPWPAGGNAHVAATGFLADSLCAWTTLAALLLIPYEAGTHSPSVRSALVRGVLWATVLSLGTMTKLNFLYFVGLIVPALVLIRLRNNGPRSALAGLIAFLLCSSPCWFYLLRWGGPAFENAKMASFGPAAKFYSVPLVQFLGNTVRESPGIALSFLLIGVALAYLVITRRLASRWPDLLALIILTGFGVLVLLSANRQIRYAFPVVIALPFLVAILMPGKPIPVSLRTATPLAVFAFFAIAAAAIPTLHRPSELCVSRSRAVLDHAAQCNAKRIMLATDSPTLNAALMILAAEVSSHGSSPKIDSMAYQVINNVPINDDFRAMNQYDQVVFQDRDELSPPFTNQRVSDYERYLRLRGYALARVGKDVTVYSTVCTQPTTQPVSFTGTPN